MILPFLANDIRALLISNRGRGEVEKNFAPTSPSADHEYLRPFYGTTIENAPAAPCLMRREKSPHPGEKVPSTTQPLLLTRSNRLGSVLLPTCWPIRSSSPLFPKPKLSGKPRGWSSNPLSATRIQYSSPEVHKMPHEPALTLQSISQKE